MDYSTFKTSTIEKMLGATAAGSAEHAALEEELRRRDALVRHKDKLTLLLFDQTEWASLSRRNYS